MTLLKKRDPMRVFFPESRAGGFSRFDGTIEFYNRVNSLLTPDSTVLDYGAGRAAWTEDPVRWRVEIRTLRGKVKCVIGADVDEAIYENRTVDENLVISSLGRIPLPDGSVDLVVADFVLEHIEQPQDFATEMDRILKPHGWICARTPNRWGYIGIITRLVPNSLHVVALKRLQPRKKIEDTFPTRYRLNTTVQLRRLFPTAAYRHATYTFESEPAYAGRSVVGWGLFRLLAGITPSSLRSVLMIFIQKHG